jgi:membrane protein YqaA with SNARE-associated domain
MEKSAKYKLVPLIILIITIIFFTYTILESNSLKGKITQTAQTNGLISIGIFSFVLDLIPQYVPPHIFILTYKLIGLNLLNILIIVIIGSTAGSLFGFEIGKRLKKHDGIFNLVGEKKIKIFEDGLNGWKKLIVSLAAISPIPYIPLILGMLSMSRKNFIIFGVVPRIIGFIVLGIFFI